MNNVAQLVECVFSVEKITEHIDQAFKEENLGFDPGERRGLGAVHLLFHPFG
jgi:hypothetical protein